MCHFKTTWDHKEKETVDLRKQTVLLEEMAQDGLVYIKENSIEVPEHARPYVRNICMAFDMHLQKSKPETRLFSMTI